MPCMAEHMAPYMTPSTTHHPPQKERPSVGGHPTAPTSIEMDGEINVAIYGGIYLTLRNTTNGIMNANQCGRLI